MKRFLYLLLITGLLAALGCGKKAPPKPEGDPEQTGKNATADQEGIDEDDGDRDEITEDKAKADAEREKLWGIWLCASVAKHGKEQDETEGRQLRFLDNGVNILDYSGKKLLAYGRCDLDVTGEVKRLDVIHPPGSPYAGKTTRAIYALDGDTLKICIGAPGAGRPTEFATKPNSARLLLHLKRQ
jgi:uncharacterized protein (TIGR03067 family)